MCDAHRQKTALTTLGMFLDGFLVSPAVIPKLSVPPSIRAHDQPANRAFMKSFRHPQAKLAVTKTRAKPPKPPTNGASPIHQFLPPMYSWEVFPPTLTTMPRMMKITIIATFREASQYSVATQSVTFSRYTELDSPTEFTVSPDIDGIYTDEEHPEDHADHPGVPSCPELQEDLSRDKVGGDGNGVVEPVIVRQGEGVRRGEKSVGVCIE